MATNQLVNAIAELKEKLKTAEEDLAFRVGQSIQARFVSLVKDGTLVRSNLNGDNYCVLTTYADLSKEFGVMKITSAIESFCSENSKDGVNFGYNDEDGTVFVEWSPE